MKHYDTILRQGRVIGKDKSMMRGYDELIMTIKKPPGGGLMINNGDYQLYTDRVYS
jgi:hypothetical protein